MIKRYLLLSIIIMMSAFFAACAGGKGAAGHPGSEESAGSGEVREEASDLDTPVEELLSRVCEHGTKTYLCAECRYETGVARISPELVSGGLVKTLKPETRRMEVPLVLNGEVQFDDRLVSHISTQAEGIIRRVNVVLGDKIKRGQPILELESVEVGEAEGALLEAQAELALARKDHERNESLYKQAILSERDFQKSKQELEVAEIKAKTSMGTLVRLGMTGRDAETADRRPPKGSLVLVSPADGTVLSLHAVPGEVARAEESLATVGDNSAVWVWASVYEKDIALLMKRPGGKDYPASVSVKAYPGEEFRGTVDFVSPVMDEQSRTVKLRVKVGNEGGRLLAGMFAEVRLFFPGTESVLSLPASAVLEDEGRSFVFIHLDGDYYIRRPVEPGKSWSGFTEIKAGLKGGETVVSDGSFLLKSDVLRSKMGAGCAD